MSRKEFPIFKALPGYYNMMVPIVTPFHPEERLRNAAYDGDPKGITVRFQGDQIYDPNKDPNLRSDKEKRTVVEKLTNSPDFKRMFDVYNPGEEKVTTTVAELEAKDDRIKELEKLIENAKSAANSGSESGG